MWSYVYNIVRIFSSKVNEKVNIDEFASNMKSGGASELPQESCSEALLPSENYSASMDCANKSMTPEEKVKVVSSSSFVITEIYYNFEDFLNLEVSSSGDLLFFFFFGGGCWKLNMQSLKPR